MEKNLYMQNPSFYDLFAIGTEMLAKRQRFFLKETENSKRIIEIGAGTGNLSLHLADNNMNVTCVEPSPAVVINLSAKIFSSSKYREKVTLIPKQLDKVDFNGKKFDAVIISNVMPYIHDDRERKNMLETASRITKRGGKLIVTFFALPMMRSEKKHFDEERQVGDSTVKRYVQYKQAGNDKPYPLVRINWFFDIYRYGKLTEKIKEEFICRCDKAHDVEALISKMGWNIESVFSDYDYSPFSKNPDSDIIVVTAKRK